MLATLCTLLSLAAPQEAPQPSTQEPAARVRTDARGWPVLQPSKSAAQAPPTGTSTDFVDVPAAPPGAAAGVPVDRPTALPSTSPLHELFARVGQPADLARLEGVVARLQFHVFDHRGIELAARTVFHEADLRVADRDRLVFDGEKRIFGRDGAAVWAEMHGMMWPALEAQARRELELLGTLVRLPWIFADADRWIVFAGEAVERDGTPYWRLRIEAKNNAPESIGPSPVVVPRDRFDLYCEPTTREPRRLEYRLADGSGLRRVDLLGQQAFGPVRIPTRWVFVRGDGTKALEIEVVRIDGEQRLPREQFQPPVR